MKAEFVNPFLMAATDVLAAELGEPPRRGTLSMSSAEYVTPDIAVLLGVSGSVEGVGVYGMSTTTACKIVEQMLGQPFPELDEMAQSGIAELANVITGHVATRLATNGYPCDISPPSMVLGGGARVSTLGRPRLVIPLHTKFGTIEIQVSLNQRAERGRAPGGSAFMAAAS